MLIASLSNPTVKRLRLLHERRGRAQQGLFLVEGVRLVEEALEDGVLPDTVLVAPAMLGATARGRALRACTCRRRRRDGAPIVAGVTRAGASGRRAGHADRLRRRPAGPGGVDRGQ